MVEQLCLNGFTLYKYICNKKIQTGVTARKRSIRIKIVDFFKPVWSWNLADDLEKQYSTSFMPLQALCIIHSHPGIAIGQFKLELQPENAQLGWKSAFFVACDLEIWRTTRKTIEHIFYSTSRFVHHFVAICEFKLKLRSGNAQIGAKFVMTSVTFTSDLDLLHGHQFFR